MLGVTASDGIWTATFALDDDRVSALGCACSACGAVLMANGTLFGRPGVSERFQHGGAAPLRGRPPRSG